MAHSCNPLRIIPTAAVNANTCSAALQPLPVRHQAPSYSLVEYHLSAGGKTAVYTREQRVERKHRDDALAAVPVDAPQITRISSKKVRTFHLQSWHCAVIAEQSLWIIPTAAVS